MPIFRVVVEAAGAADEAAAEAGAAELAAADAEGAADADGVGVDEQANRATTNTATIAIIKNFFILYPPLIFLNQP
jgi:hypothetical protein